MMDCPKCTGETTVIKTRPGTMVSRMRRCRDCGVRIMTEETVVKVGFICMRGPRPAEHKEFPSYAKATEDRPK